MTVHAADTVITVPVLLAMFLTCQIPVPPVILIWKFVHLFVAQFIPPVIFVSVVAPHAVAVPVAKASLDGVHTIFASVPIVAGSPVVVNAVHIPVNGSYDLKIFAATVPPFKTIYNPESMMNVSVFATTHGRASNVMTVFVAGVTYTSVTNDCLPAFAPVKNLMVLPFAIPLNIVDVVTVVVEPAVAVYVALHLILVPHVPEPKVPAKAPEGICTQASSSW